MKNKHKCILEKWFDFVEKVKKLTNFTVLFEYYGNE